MRLVGLSAFVIVTVLTVTMTALSIRQLAGPEASGRVGTVLVTRCAGRLGSFRQCFGDFASTDGQVKLTGIHISGAHTAQTGDKFVAYGDPATRTVTLPGGTRFAVLSVTLVCLAIWAALLWRVMLRRRRARER